MQRVYDMSTGRPVEETAATGNVQQPHFDATELALELQLQPVTNESLPEKGLPPELVLADLNAFLDKMS